MLVVALATIAALPMFVFENPNSPGAATEVAAAAAPERAPEQVVIELVVDASVSGDAAVVDEPVVAESSDVPAPLDPAPPERTDTDAARIVAEARAQEDLEAEARAQEELRFEAEALALAAEIAEAEFVARQALHVFLEAKQAELDRQAERARMRAEEEDRRAEAIATPGPTTTIPADTVPAEFGPTAEQWEALRFCEATGNYGAVSPTGNYRGAYQFSRVTWDWIAGIYHEQLVGLDPAEVAPADQDAMAQSLYDLRGRGQWPVCGRYLP
ncbi:MAG: transglycosylase family protein [Actinobacteria bacterium]|nr:transglycosylase family protein [Actinomycetota bacterium]